MDNDDHNRKMSVAEQQLLQGILNTNMLIAQRMVGHAPATQQVYPGSVMLPSDGTTTSIVSDMNSTAKSNKRNATDSRILKGAKIYFTSKRANIDKSPREALESAGFSVDELSERSNETRLKNALSSAVYELKKKEEIIISFPVHPINRSRIILTQKDDALLEILQHINDVSFWYKEGKWVDVEDSNLRQWVVTNYQKLLRDVSRKDVKLRLMLVNLFIKHGFTLRDRGIQFNKMIATALYTRNESYEAQRIHTDYALKSVRYKRGGKDFLAWTAHLPVTDDGSWIWVWPGPGNGYPIHIKMGQILFLRSDVVHCGGRPPIDKLEGQKYMRLHFFLPTAFQPPPKGDIFLTDHDNLTPLHVSHAFHDFFVQDTNRVEKW